MVSVSVHRPCQETERLLQISSLSFGATNENMTVSVIMRMNDTWLWFLIVCDMCSHGALDGGNSLKPIRLCEDIIHPNNQKTLSINIWCCSALPSLFSTSLPLIYLHPQLCGVIFKQIHSKYIIITQHAPRRAGLITVSREELITAATTNIWKSPVKSLESLFSMG